MIYKLYTSVGADAAASFDVSLSGTIVAVWWSASAQLDATNEELQAEVSFASQSGFAQTDARASISGIMIRNAMLTSGAIESSENSGISGLSIPVDAGERIYLHAAVTGPTTCRISVWLYVEDGESGKPKTRRR